MTDSAGGRLSQFQIDAASLFFSLPESAGFLLAGGGALIAQGLVDRDTEDLDFFAQRGADVGSATVALIGAAEGRGWGTDVLRSGPQFKRVRLTRRGRNGNEEAVYIDLAIDTPLSGAPTITIAGPALPPPASWRSERRSRCSVALNHAISLTCTHSTSTLIVGISWPMSQRLTWDLT